MARNYATIATAIWRPGSDFLDLSDNAQRIYFMLITQPDITAAGVLSLNLKRWTGRSADGSRDKLLAGLRELQAARFLVYDEETEEVLIRTFVKWDGGWQNQKRRPVIERAAMEVESPGLRRVMAAEFGRLGLRYDYLFDGPVEPFVDPFDGHVPTPDDIGAPSLADLPAVPKPETISSHDVGEPQVNTVSHTADPFEGVVVTTGTYVETTTHNPQPTTRAASSDAECDTADPEPEEEDLNTEEPATTCDAGPPTVNGAAVLYLPAGSRAARRKAAKSPTAGLRPSTAPERNWTDEQIYADPMWIAFYAAYPRKEARGHARKAWLAALRNGADPAAIVEAAERYRDKPGRTAKFTKLPATWLHGECWNDLPAEPAAAGHARPFWEN